jgi:hypothetical protein
MPCIGAVAGYLSLWLVYWLFQVLTGKEGMGYGDFKLAGRIWCLAWLEHAAVDHSAVLPGWCHCRRGDDFAGAAWPWSALPLVLIWLLPAGSPCCGARILSVGIWVVMSIKVIGLTGGIGSGKSAAASHFAALGVPVVDTDVIAHQLTAPGGAAMPADCGRVWPGCGGMATVPWTASECARWYLPILPPTSLRRYCIR